MKDYSKIKTGDIGFVYFKFNSKNMDTWISGFVRFFMNFQSWVLGRELIRNQHCGIFAWVGGELYFYESVGKGFVSTPAYLRFAGVWDNVIIKRYYDINLESPLISNLKSKYNFFGILLQLVRQLTFNIVDFEAQKIGTKRTYCSQSCGYLINKMSGGKYCQYWHSMDTQDLYFDKASKIIEIKNPLI